MRSQVLDVIALVGSVAVVICALADYGWVEAVTAALAIAALVALRWRVHDSSATPPTVGGGEP